MYVFCSKMIYKVEANFSNAWNKEGFEFFKSKWITSINYVRNKGINVKDIIIINGVMRGWKMWNLFFCLLRDLCFVSSTTLYICTFYHFCLFPASVSYLIMFLAKRKNWTIRPIVSNLLAGIINFRGAYLMK